MIDAEGWSWATLHTYEAVLAELDNPDAEPVADGKQTLIEMAQRYGG